MANPLSSSVYPRNLTSSINSRASNNIIGAGNIQRGEINSQPNNLNDSDIQRYNKLNLFIQELVRGEPLSDCISSLNLSPESNFLQRFENFMSVTLSDLQISGGVIAYVVENGIIPNVEQLTSFLHGNGVYSFVTNGAGERVINSFLRINTQSVDSILLNHAKYEHYKTIFRQLNNNEMNQTDIFNLLNMLIRKFYPAFIYNPSSDLNIEFINNINQAFLRLDSHEQRSSLTKKLILKIYRHHHSAGLNSYRRLDTEFEVLYGENFYSLMNDFINNQDVSSLICDLFIEGFWNIYTPRISANNDTPIIIVKNLRSTDRIGGVLDILLGENRLSLYQKFYLILPLTNGINDNQEITEIMQRVITKIAEEAISDTSIFNTTPGFLSSLLSMRGFLPPLIYNQLPNENYTNIRSRRGIVRSIASRNLDSNRQEDSFENVVRRVPSEARENLRSLLAKLPKDERNVFIRIIQKITIDFLSETLRKSLVHIIAAMNNSAMVLQSCLRTASGYWDTCRDGARIVIILMLLDVQTNSESLTITDGLEVAQTKRQIMDVFNYVRQKMGDHGDHVEVALRLLLELQERGYMIKLGVDDMLHSGMADDRVFSEHGISIEQAVEKILQSSPVKEYEILQGIFPELESMSGNEYIQGFAKIREEFNTQLDELFLENSGQLDESQQAELEIKANQISNQLHAALLDYVKSNAKEIDASFERK